MNEVVPTPPRVGADCEQITEPLYATLRATNIRDGVLADDAARVTAEWVRSLQPEVRHLLVAHACYIDVGCGTFPLFYGSLTGALADEAVEGLRALGLPGCASVVAEANRFFGPSVPRDHLARYQLLTSGGIYAARDVDPLWCRIGFREVARQGEVDWRKEWDFNELDFLFREALEAEAPDGFLTVADAYARRITAEPPPYAPSDLYKT